MGPFAKSLPRWRLWPIQVLGEDRPTGMTAGLEALIADWISVTPGGNRADCTARRRCSSTSSRSRPRVPEAATTATASATRLGLKSARVVRSRTYLASARRRAADASISGKDDRTRAARGPPADVRRASASARGCQRLGRCPRRPQGTRLESRGPSAQTPPSPRRSRRQRRPDARARPSFLSERLVIVGGDDRSSRGSGRTTTDSSDAPICDGSPMRVHYAAGEIDGEEYGRRPTRFFEVR